MPRDCPGVNATSYSYFGFSPDHPFVFPSRELFRFGAGRAPLAAALAITGPLPSGRPRVFRNYCTSRYFFSSSPSYLLLLFSFCPRNCALTVFCRYFPLFFPPPFFSLSPSSFLSRRQFRASSSSFRERESRYFSLLSIFREGGREGGRVVVAFPEQGGNETGCETWQDLHPNWCWPDRFTPR